MNGGAAFGLRLTTKDNSLWFGRENKLPANSDKAAQREVFSACGSLVGHYSISVWLRVAYSYIKRRAKCSNWDDQVVEAAVEIINEVITRVQEDDPVKVV